jgi:deoxyadenosine/deoxycytidine kinase
MSGYFSHPNIKIVWVEGAIGVGKSTLCDAVLLKANIPGVKIVMVDEPVALWLKLGALQAFGKDPIANAALFQNLTFSTRIGEFIKGYDRARSMLEAKECKSVLLVSERSWWTDRYVFKETLVADGSITDLHSKWYNAQFDSWMLAVQGRGPDLVLLLDISIDRVKESLKRIRERDRLGEDSVDDKYQKKLFDAHDREYGNGNFHGKPVLKVDTALDYTLPENADAAQKIVAHVATLFK